jgi:hypothetical protein
MNWLFCLPTISQVHRLSSGERDLSGNEKGGKRCALPTGVSQGLLGRGEENNGFQTWRFGSQDERVILK